MTVKDSKELGIVDEGSFVVPSRSKKKRIPKAVTKEMMGL